MADNSLRNQQGYLLQHPQPANYAETKAYGEALESIHSNFSYFLDFAFGVLREIEQPEPNHHSNSSNSSISHKIDLNFLLISGILEASEEEKAEALKARVLYACFPEWQK